MSDCFLILGSVCKTVDWLLAALFVGVTALALSLSLSSKSMTTLVLSLLEMLGAWVGGSTALGAGNI